MTLLKLLNDYVGGERLEHYKTYLDDGDISPDIPEFLSGFLAKFKSGTQLSDKDFQEFSQYLDHAHFKVRTILIKLLFEFAAALYSSQRRNIEAFVQQIDNSLEKGEPIPQHPPAMATYCGLLNAYHLSTFVEKDYPGCDRYVINFQVDKEIRDNVFFSINTLRLVGCIPKSGFYCSMDLSRPLYPFTEKPHSEKIPIRAGIKASSDYFPYKRVHKIAKGDTGNNTIVATDGRKALYVRCVVESPYKTMNHAILASKIARLVSPEHFASERLLDNRLAASRKLRSFATSLGEQEKRHQVQANMRTGNILLGAGIIDEVTNFVQEGDSNPENFGISSDNHFSKIDYDHCSLSEHVRKETYEQDMLGGEWRGIYREFPKYKKESSYVREKLNTRLKLALIPEALFRELANKAWEKDEPEKEAAIKECVHRANVAKSLFFRHPKRSAFLKENPQAFQACYDEIASYIKRHHFEGQRRSLLLWALNKRTESIYNNIPFYIRKKVPFTLQPVQRPIFKHSSKPSYNLHLGLLTGIYSGLGSSGVAALALAFTLVNIATLGGALLAGVGGALVASALLGGTAVAFFALQNGRTSSKPNNTVFTNC